MITVKPILHQKSQETLTEPYIRTETHDQMHVLLSKTPPKGKKRRQKGRMQ